MSFALQAYNYTREIAPSATWDIASDASFLSSICRVNLHPMSCSWLGLTFNCIQGYDFNDSTMVSYIIRGHNITFILLFLIAVYNGILLLNEISHHKKWLKKGLSKKIEDGSARGSADGTAGNATSATRATKTDGRDGMVDEFWLFRANQIWYAFVTSLFALFRLHYHLGKPLLIGAALHNLSEWYMIVYAFNKTPSQRKKYSILALKGICVIILWVLLVPQFELYALGEQLTGIVCDYLLPFIWFELLLKQKPGSQLRDAFTFAFLAHFFHLIGTIIPLVIENVIVSESTVLSIALESAIFATGPLAHILYTIFTTRYQKLVISTKYFADNMVLNDHDFKRLLLIASILGVCTTAVFPAITPLCNQENLRDLQNLPPLLDGLDGLDGLDDNEPVLPVVVGRAIGKVKIGFEQDFENYILQEKLIENALNWEGNNFYYFIRDNGIPKRDIKSGEYYTEYQFFESWNNKFALDNWLSNFAHNVFNTHLVKSFLIGEQLEYPSNVGYTLNQEKLYEKYPLLNVYDNTPSWYYGYVAVGSRVRQQELQQDLKEGLELEEAIMHRKTERYPLPCSKVWNIFDDYLQFQKSNPRYFNVKHHSGGMNEIGQIIKFDVNLGNYNYTTYEELSLRNSNEYILQIKKIDDTDTIFNKYQLTIKLFNDTRIDVDIKNNNNNMLSCCLAVIDMEYQFNKIIDKQMIKSIKQYNLNYLNFYTKFLYDNAILKNGETASGKAIVHVNIDWLFNFFTNWTNVAWVPPMDPNSLVMLQNDVRRVMIIGDNSREIIERISIKDKKNYHMQYQVLNCHTTGLYSFQDDIYFTKLGKDKTEINAKMVFVPINQSLNTMYQESYQILMTKGAKFWSNGLKPIYQKSIQSQN